MIFADSFLQFVNSLTLTLTLFKFFFFGLCFLCYGAKSKIPLALFEGLKLNLQIGNCDAHANSDP